MADHSKIINDLNRVINYERTLRTAATTVHSLMVQRIFTDGKQAAGANIGNYSKTPAYFNPNRSPKKFSPKGKAGKSKFKNGKQRKTRYFETGYAGFRAAAGRQNSKVDLTLTGTLRSSFVLAAQSPGFVSKFQNAKQALIAEGNEKRFDSVIFELTPAEENAFVKILEDMFDVD